MDWENGKWRQERDDPRVPLAWNGSLTTMAFGCRDHKVVISCREADVEGL